MTRRSGKAWRRSSSARSSAVRLSGDAPSAHALAEALVKETTAEGRPELRAAATRSIERLAAGPLVKHVGASLRRVEDVEVEFLNRLCHTIGRRRRTPAR
jgi:hypothetical protein